MTAVSISFRSTRTPVRLSFTLAKDQNNVNTHTHAFLRGHFRCYHGCFSTPWWIGVSRPAVSATAVFYIFFQFSAHFVSFSCTNTHLICAGVRTHTMLHIQVLQFIPAFQIFGTGLFIVRPPPIPLFFPSPTGHFLPVHTHCSPGAAGTRSLWKHSYKMSERSLDSLFGAISSSSAHAPQQTHSQLNVQQSTTGTAASD